MSKFCSEEGCMKEATIPCTASCCFGETLTCEDHPHREQQVLDRLGYTADTFDEATDRTRACAIVEKLWNGVSMLRNRVGSVVFL